MLSNKRQMDAHPNPIKIALETYALPSNQRNWLSSETAANIEGCSPPSGSGFATIILRLSR
jgi:hypothetical protein